MQATVETGTPQDGRAGAKVSVTGRKHPTLTSSTAVAGGALVVLVGHDGSPLWQAVRVLVVAIAFTAAVAVELRWSDRQIGLLAVTLGAITFAVGLGFLPHLVKTSVTLVSSAGFVEVVAGVVLVVWGARYVVRGRRLMRRVAGVAGTVLMVALVAYIISPGVAATNVPRPELDATPATRGLAYEDVALRTPDGVRLAGWYVPSQNRAAVILLHGAGSTRSSVLDHAAILSRHGFGVLLVDARGHGESGGRAMDFGWHGDDDIAAATEFLLARSDVDRTRVGIVGLSMGGEEAIGATATNRVIRAVVAEGATARSGRDKAWLSDEFGLRGALQETLDRLQDRVTDVLTTASPPTPNRTAVEASDETQYLLITAGNVTDERRAATYVAAGAPDRVVIWTVAGAGHTKGLETQPDEWERRVIAFLVSSLDLVVQGGGKS